MYPKILYCLCFSVISFRLLAQTPDEIIQRHVEAIGGIDSWRNVNTLLINGTTKVKGTDVLIHIAILNGKAMRMSFTAGGMEGFQIITPTAGWSYSPMQGDTIAQKLPPDVVKNMQTALYTQGPLIDYKVKGNKINFMGKKTIDGTECYKLKLTYLTTGIEEMVYIQTSNFYAIKYATTKQQDSTANEEILQYSNFKKLDGGLVFPMNIQSSAGNIVINSIEINKEIPESLFTPAINKP